MKKTLLTITYFFIYIFSIHAQILYGTTLKGGSDGGGTIDKFLPATNDLTVTKSFESLAANPGYTSFIQASNGKLYGMTLNGGSSGYGAIFSYDPSSSTYVKIKDFDSANGANPYGSLVQAGNGKLYGMTTYGGSSNYGVIFSYDPSTSIYTKLKDFDNTIGANPIGSLVQARDGKLYGVAANGGTNNYGVIFSFDPSSSTYTQLKDFDYTNGANPIGNLIQSTDGKLYGMTSFGGTLNFGIIFSFDLSSSILTKLKDFDYTNGEYPYGSLLQATDGKLYGMTSQGGVNSSGVIFSFDRSTSILKTLKDFDYTNNAFPYGSLIQAKDGKLYGMTSQGGSSTGAGVIFSIVPSTSIYTKLKDFDISQGGYPSGSLMQAKNGKLYGMTSYGGSSYNNGVIFSIDPSSYNYAMLKDFGTNAIGSNVSASLTQGIDGNLYGMSNVGGNGGRGLIFSFNPSSSTYTKLKDFNYTDGANPYGSLTQARDGKFYGMTTDGGIDIFGESAYGVIFSFNPSSSTYTKVFDFDNLNIQTGGIPYGNLLQATDGKLYGMTSSGGGPFQGASGVGVIFSFDPLSSTYSIVKNFNTYDFNTGDFDYSDGGNPYGSLIQASDGKLYGMTNSGGNSGAGVIFSFDLSTSIYTKLKDFDNFNGGNPYGSLIQASDGKLYGMTYDGGNSGTGVIFSFDLSTSTYTKLKEFDNANGANPYGTLLEASDGKFYGMTNKGGSNDLGVIFSFDPVTSTYIKLKDYTGANGANPYIGSAFIEVQESTTALLSINDAIVYASAGSVTLTVTLSKKFAKAVSVNYKTVDGTARNKAHKPNPSDYTAKSGTVTIPAGSQTGTISILIGPDNQPEPTENFYVELNKAVNAAIGKSTGTVTILSESPSVGLSNAQQQIVFGKQQIATEFKLNVSPNPSSSEFKLKIEPDNTRGILSLRVVDVFGKVIEIKNNFFAGQTLQIGNNYRPGIYFVEVTQGKNKKQLKLIKN